MTVFYEVLELIHSETSRNLISDKFPDQSDIGQIGNKMIFLYIFQNEKCRLKNLLRHKQAKFCTVNVLL